MLLSVVVPLLAFNSVEKRYIVGEHDDDRACKIISINKHSSWKKQEGREHPGTLVYLKPMTDDNVNVFAIQ